MTLLDIREQLVQASGRTDLVVDTQNYADDGADRYIRAGQRFLDDRLPTPKDTAELVKSVAPGDASFSFPRIRAVESVRIQESGKEPNVLTEWPLTRFYKRFGDLEYILANSTQGKPKRYALGIFRDSSPQTQEGEEKMILFHPPTDKEYDLVLTAKYFSAELRNDSDESWWSLTYPDVLVMAARRRLEIEHRNKEGANQFEQTIRRKLQDIDSNLVREESSGIDQMQDAWRHRESKL